MALDQIHALLIQPWVTRAEVVHEEIEAPLRAAGFTPRLTRVDFASALAAALSRDTFDVVLLDPHTPGLTRPLVEELLRDYHVRAPLVVLGDPATLGEHVRAALVAQRN